MKNRILFIAVLCCGLVSQNALAQSNLGPRAAGVQLGIVDAEGADAAMGFGGFMDWGTLTPNIRLASHLDYWSKSEGSFGVEASVRDIALSMRGKYMFPSKSPKFHPYAGAGLGMHFLNAKVEMPGFPTIEDSATKLGVDVGGGFSTPLSPKTDLQTELWYGIVSDYNQLALKVGLAFRLGM